MPTALITGASRGIGRAIAIRLSGDYTIIALSRSKADLDRLEEEIQQHGGECETIVADVGDPAAVAKALAGRDVDVLVNNAGVGVLKPMMELAESDWQRMVAVNFNGMFYVTRALLAGMLERGRGHIVNIGSIAGRSAFVGGTCYAATKHAVMAFSESLMLEVRDRGVKVSVVNPGSVATEFSERRDPSWMLSGEDVAESVAHVLATPANVLVHRLEVRALSPHRTR